MDHNASSAASSTAAVQMDVPLGRVETTEQRLRLGSTTHGFLRAVTRQTPRQDLLRTEQASEKLDFVHGMTEIPARLRAQALASYEDLREVAPRLNVDSLGMSVDPEGITHLRLRGNPRTTPVLAASLQRLGAAALRGDDQVDPTPAPHAS